MASLPGEISFPESGRTPGDFAVCPISGYGGKLIGLGEWANGGRAFTRWHHALIYAGGGLVLQAEPGGAELVERGVLPGDLWSTGLPQFELSPAQVDAVGVICSRLEGVPYSWADYGALALRRLRIPAPHLRAYIRSSGHMICSQLVDHARLEAGSHLFTDGRWEGYVTPYDLGLLLEEAGATEVGR